MKHNNPLKHFVLLTLGFLLLAVPMTACKKVKNLLPTPTAKESLAYMPKDAVFIVRLNFEQGKKSPLFAKYKEEIMSTVAGPLGELKEKCNIDPVEMGKELLLGIDDLQSPDSFVLVAKGTFTKEQVTSCITKMSSSAEAETGATTPSTTTVNVEENPETKIVTVSGGEEQPVFLMWPGKETVVISTNLEKLKASIQSAKDSKEPAVKSNPAFAKAMAKMNANATFSAIGAFDESFAEKIKEINPMLGMIPAMPQDMGLNITAQDALAIVLDLGFDTEDNAKKIAGMMDMAKTLPVPEEDKDLLETLKTSQVGPEVKVNIDLSTAQIDRLVEQAKSAQQMMGN